MSANTSPCPSESGICDFLHTNWSAHVNFSRNKYITAQENGKKYTVENVNQECIAKAKVDGGILSGSDGKKADYMIVRCDYDIIYFVELKGCDVSKACSQILETIQELGEIITTSSKINARVVCSRNSVPNIRSWYYRKLDLFCTKKGGSLNVKSRQLIEKYDRS